MFERKSWLFFLLLLGLNINLFSYNSKKESEEIVLAHLNASQKIIRQFPEWIVGYVEGKLYLDERLVLKTVQGIFLNMPNEKKLAVPSIYTDSGGFYIITLAKVGEKFFKCICNKCDFEWEGNVFDVWCPRCGSSDFRIVRNR